MGVCANANFVPGEIVMRHVVIGIARIERESVWESKGVLRISHGAYSRRRQVLGERSHFAEFPRSSRTDRERANRCVRLTRVGERVRTRENEAGEFVRDLQRVE